MTDCFQLTKLDAARRQLRVAIRLLFDGVDPIAVHTLVGAASIIISNLTDQQHPENSWDRFIQKANNISASEYFQIMRKPQNFLKHANPILTHQIRSSLTQLKQNQSPFGL